MTIGDKRLLRRVSQVKQQGDGSIRPESSQFEVSTRPPNDDYRMSVDAEWIILEANDIPEQVCLANHQGFGLVAIPLQLIDDRTDIAFDLDGKPRPSHGGVYRVSEEGEHDRRTLPQGFRRALARESVWLTDPERLLA